MFRNAIEVGSSQGTVAETEGHWFLLITNMFSLDVPLWWFSSFLLRNYQHSLQARGAVANVALHFLSLALSLSRENSGFYRSGQPGVTMGLGERNDVSRECKISSSRAETYTDI